MRRSPAGRCVGKHRAEPLRPPHGAEREQLGAVTTLGIAGAKLWFRQAAEQDSPLSDADVSRVPTSFGEMEEILAGRSWAVFTRAAALISKGQKY